MLNPQFLLQGFGLFLGFCGGLLGLFQFGAVSFLLCPFGGLSGLVCGFCFTPYRVDFRVPFGLADFLSGGLFSFPPGGLESFFLLGFGFFQCLAVLLSQGFHVCRCFGFGFRAGLVGGLFQFGFNVNFMGFRFGGRRCGQKGKLLGHVVLFVNQLLQLGNGDICQVSGHFFPVLRSQFCQQCQLRNARRRVFFNKLRW